ncbi:MAG: Holliday junction branch migration DNA helicase RuvB [Rickettsiales bacterium]|jgi:holliday junction DNA helicase RuvB|nr:Holliday junction branch migration DNA helicase RuvB [Rickettsiales bacterium]
MQQEISLVNAEISEVDAIYGSLRPESFDGFIGQKQLKENLKIFITAAGKRREVMDHILFYGPPGLGKTTLAQIISIETKATLISTSGPLLTKAGDIASIITSLKEGDILFIDEIHRMNISVEEILYSAMEDFKLDILIGEGPSARTVKIDLPKFTLIGATTRMGMISAPLRDRFGIPLRLEFYKPEELERVLVIAAQKLNIKFDQTGSGEIARRSRGTPRIALRLLKRVRDFADCADTDVITSKIADIALNNLEIDKYGLDSNDRRYIAYIKDHYDGGPVGIETIAAALSEQRDTIEETIEPYLIQEGFIAKTPKGRILLKL